MDKLKEIQTNRNNENQKHYKGIRKIITGIVLLASAAVLIAVGPSIPAIAAIDSFATGIVGGVVSPLVLGGIGLFGVTKTISGGLKAAKAKKNIKDLDVEETKEFERIAQEKNDLEAQNQALRIDNAHDEQAFTETLSDVKAALQAASQQGQSQTSALENQMPVIEEQNSKTLEL